MDDLERFYLTPSHDAHPSFHTEASDDRRQLIIVAAYQLIVEKGFAGFRIRDAAQRAGITGATLYYYFPTKEALIQSVDGYLTQLIMQRQARWSSQKFTSPREHLHAHLTGIQELLQDDPAVFIALSELSVRGLRDPAIQAVLDSGEKGWQGYLASIFVEGIQQGQFRADIDPASAAWVVLSFIKGMNMRSQPETITVGIAQLEMWLAAPPL
jgi:AcrR family transcriptional regulator